MQLITILNRLSFSRLPNFIFSENLPILIGTARGGHTSAQNWINVTVLDYLGIEYFLSSNTLSINFKNKKGTKPLEPLDLRSVFKFKYPLWGYIANDPGHAFGLKNRRIFIFLRSPYKIFQSLFVLARDVYQLSDEKAKKYSLNYLNNWSIRFSNLQEISNHKNFEIHCYKSESLFKSPTKYVNNILEITGFPIPEDSISKSINKYNERIEKMKQALPINSPRRSYKSKYSEMKEEEMIFIENLYLYKYYKKIGDFF